MLISASGMTACMCQKEPYKFEFREVEIEVAVPKSCYNQRFIRHEGAGIELRRILTHLESIREIV